MKTKIIEAVDAIARLYDGPPHGGYEKVEAVIRDAVSDDSDSQLTGPGYTPNVKLPRIGDGPRRKMLIEIEVSADFEKRLDNQWMIEREIHADRWSWRWA